MATIGDLQCLTLERTTPSSRPHLFHENDNLKQRLFWYLFSQSLMFGAYSSTLNHPDSTARAIVAGQQETLMSILPVTALLVSCVLYPMIVSSVIHMSGLRRKFTAQAGTEIDDLPPIHGDPTLRKIADAGYLTIPLILTGAWLLLLVKFVRATLGAA